MALDVRELCDGQFDEEKQINPFVELITSSPSTAKFFFMARMTHLSISAYHIGGSIPGEQDTSFGAFLSALNFSHFHALEFLRLDFPRVDWGLPELQRARGGPRFPWRLKVLELIGFSWTKNEDLLRPVLEAVTRDVVGLEKLAVGTRTHLCFSTTSKIAKLSQLQELSIHIQRTHVPVRPDNSYNLRSALASSGYSQLRSLRLLRHLQLCCAIGLLSEGVFDEECLGSLFPKLRGLECAWTANVHNTLARFPAFFQRIANNATFFEAQKFTSVHPLYFAGTTGRVRYSQAITTLPQNITLKHVTSLNIIVQLLPSSEYLLQLRNLEHLRSLSVHTTMLLEHGGANVDDVPRMFLSNIHTFPALEVLKCGEQVTHSWHAFTLADVCDSFSKAAREKQLRFVTIQRCTICSARFPFDDGDCIETHGFGDEHDPDFSVTREYAQKLLDRIKCHEVSDLLDVPSFDDVFLYLERCNSCEELKALNKAFGQVNTAPTAMYDKYDRTFRCEMQLRQALTFWKSVHSHLTISIEEGSEMGIPPWSEPLEDDEDDEE